MGDSPVLSKAVVEFYGGKPIPRGVRNNNPGNIRLSRSHWQGLCEVQRDPSFCQFDDYIHGLRAIAVLLYIYVVVDDVTTVSDIVARWAPASENNTHAYVADVCQRTGLRPNHAVDVVAGTDLAKMAQALCEHECGAPLPYSADDYSNAVKLARGSR